MQQLMQKLVDCLTFTKFVEEKNNVSGSFFFCMQLLTKMNSNDGEAPVKVTVNGDVKFNSKVTK